MLYTAVVTPRTSVVWIKVSRFMWYCVILRLLKGRVAFSRKIAMFDEIVKHHHKRLHVLYALLKSLVKNLFLSG